MSLLHSQPPATMESLVPGHPSDLGRHVGEDGLLQEDGHGPLLVLLALLLHLPLHLIPRQLSQAHPLVVLINLVYLTLL